MPTKKPKRPRRKSAKKDFFGVYAVGSKPARTAGKSAKAKRKAARKRASSPRIVEETLRELTAPLSRAYWGGEAAQARKAGRFGVARGRLRAGRDPFEAVKPKLP